MYKPLSPLRVGVDIDEVLGSFITPYVAQLYAIRGEIAPPFDPTLATQWKVEKQLGFTHDEVEEFWRYANSVEGKEFWANRPALESCYVMDPLFNAGADVYFVTKCPYHLYRTQQQWISNHYNVTEPRIIMAGDKGMVAGGMELHAMIDDKPDNLLRVLNVCGTKCLPILIDCGHNKDFHHDYVLRAFGLTHAIAILLDRWRKETSK